MPDTNVFIALLLFLVMMCTGLIFIGVSCIYEIRENIKNTDSDNKHFELHALLVLLTALCLVACMMINPFK